MKIRAGKSAETKVEQQMTAMIDVVFQLLTFFVMSFRVASLEGDFSVKMPLAQKPTTPNSDDIEVPSLKLRLQAADDGSLRSVVLNNVPIAGWSALRERIVQVVQTSPHSAELEIEADYQLAYHHVIEAMDAVSGYPAGNGKVVKLVEKIKFAPPLAIKNVVAPGL
jgi:biopolymer transport protein ExbD